MAVFNNILAGASAGASSQEPRYSIDRSVRFNSADSAYLNRTPSTAGNRKTWTWAAWVKRSNLGTVQKLFAAATLSPFNQAYIEFSSSDQIVVINTDNGSVINSIYTSALYRDLSAWYHIVVATDTTEATGSDRTKIYVNGLQVTQFSSASYPTLNFETHVNNTITHAIGRYPQLNSNYIDAYLEDVHFIDGQALDPSSFGKYDSNNVWQPKEYSGTYGTNGFHLDFSDNSTAAALGTDTSGNSNTWTVNNISVATGAGNDSLVDSPTNGTQTDTGVGGEVRGNYCTFNPLAKIINTGAAVNYSDGNLQAEDGSNGGQGCRVGTIAISSGKFYWESVKTDGDTADNAIGIIESTVTSYVTPYDNSTIVYRGNGTKYVNGSPGSYGASWGVNDIIGVALDMTAAQITFYKNGVSQGAFSIDATKSYLPMCGNNVSNVLTTWVANFGQRAFAYTAPSGYKALCTANLPEPTIADGSTYFDTKLYTGNGTTQTISGLNFSPDLVWIKNRKDARHHGLYDTVRGATNRLISNLTSAETVISGVTSFTSDGFVLGSNNNENGLNEELVAWCWDAGDTTVTNNDGSITSQVRANPEAGFSVVTWTGNGGVSASVGHGLGVAPSLYFTKCRDFIGGLNDYWGAFTTATGSMSYGFLNETDAFATPSQTAPTSTTINVLSAFENVSDKRFVAYCWAPVEGYSAFGSYTGNGNADGTFVYTGFRPRWIIYKQSTSIGSGHWNIFDSARDTYNIVDANLQANRNVAEFDFDAIDILSNGFKLRTTSTNHNANGGTYIYAAFAEHPFATARAR